MGPSAGTEAPGRAVGTAEAAPVPAVGGPRRQAVDVHGRLHTQHRLVLLRRRRHCGAALPRRLHGTALLAMGGVEGRGFSSRHCRRRAPWRAGGCTARGWRGDWEAACAAVTETRFKPISSLKDIKI